MRPLSVLALALLLVAGSARAGAPFRLARESAACQGLRPLEIEYRFGTGAAPAAPPALGPDGSAYVVTAESYVHALHPDGSYRWSYTLTGRVTGRPTVLASGVVMVPTEHRIYALRPEGRPLWVFRSPVAVVGDLVADSRGRVHFGSATGTVFALSGRGGVVGHLPGRVPLSADPLSLAADELAMGRKDGSVIVGRLGHTRRFQLGSPIERLLACRGAVVCALAGGELHALSEGEGSWHIRARRAAANRKGLAVLTSDRSLSLFSGIGQGASSTTTLPEAASAAPALGQDGFVYVPLLSGELLQLRPDGTPAACAKVAASPLGEPVIGDGAVLVTAGEGILARVSTE